VSDDPTRLHYEVSGPGGNVFYRWSEDDWDAANRLTDSAFTTDMPGGFGTFNGSLLRDLPVRADEGLFNTLTAYGPGGQVAWQGRITQLPRQTGGGRTLQPQAVGWSAHLQDRQDFVEVYIDRNPGSWGEMIIERRAALAIAGYHTEGLSASSTTDGLAWDADPAVPYGSVVELWYRAPAGTLIAKLFWTYQRLGVWTGMEVPTVYFSSDGLGITYFEAFPGGTSGVAPVSPSSGRWVMLRAANTSGAPIATGAGAKQLFSRHALVGSHGLDTHSGPFVYAHDVVDDVVSRMCPKLSATLGSSIATSTTGVELSHLVFDTPTHAADVIATVNAPHGYDWAVWEPAAGQILPTFYFRPQRSGTAWRTSIREGAQMNFEGDSAEQLINGVVVSYNGLDGLPRLAGPTATGIAYDVQSSFLWDSSVGNPVNQHGLTRLHVLNASVALKDDVAVAIGQVYLRDSNAATRRGDITLPSTVRDASGAVHPSWAVRAGDTIEVTDLPDTLARRIVTTSYNHQARSLTASIDQTPARLSTLLARLGWNTGN